MRTIALWLSVAAIFTFPSEDMLKVSDDFGSISRAVGLTIAAFWIVTVLTTGRVRKLQPMHLVITLFVFWNALSLFWSVDTNRTVDRLQSYLQMFGLFALIWDVFRTQSDLRIGLQAYVLGTYIPMLSLLYNFANGVTHYTYGGRYSPTGAHPNGVGLVMALSMPIAWYLAVSWPAERKNHLLRYLYYAHTPIAFFCIVLTASRGSLLATLPVGLLVLTSAPRLSAGQRAAAFGVLFAVLVGMIPLIPQSSIERLGTTSSEIQSADLNGRVDIWQQGLEAFLEHPILGVGANAFRSAIEMERAPHNTPISVIVEVGFAGFLLFAAMMLMVFAQVLRTPPLELKFWMTVLAIWFVGAMCHNWEHTKHTWLIVSLVCVGANLPSLRRPAARPSQFSWRVQPC